MRLYLVDGYNVIHRNPRFSGIVAREGLAASRQSLRVLSERLARRSGSRIRLVFDGTKNPMDHTDVFENRWIEVSFTSAGEEADERLVAVATEVRRQGLAPVIVSDDRKGVCGPLMAKGFRLMSTEEFEALLKQVPDEESKASGFSRAEHLELERTFLAGDADRLRQQMDLPGDRGRKRLLQPSGAEPTPVNTHSRPVSTRSKRTPPPERTTNPEDDEPRASALSPGERLEIEAAFLARDGERVVDEGAEGGDA